MLALMTHYGYLFLSLAISAVFLAGGIFGFLISWAVLKKKATEWQADAMKSERRALLTRHRADMDIIIDLENRLFTRKAQFAELTAHLGRAMEAIK